MAKVNCTFKTEESTKKELSEMAGFIKKHQFSFDYGDRIKQCTTRSALINTVVTGQITIEQINQKINEVKQNDGNK